MLEKKNKVKKLIPHFTEDKILQIVRLPYQDFDTIYYQSGKVSKYKKEEK